MNHTELRDALTGLYNHTDDPRLIEEIRKVVERVSTLSDAGGEVAQDAFREIITICTESAGDCRRRMGTRVGNCIATAEAALASLAIVPPAGSGESFQQRVQPWMLACFGAEISADVAERNHRFLEEALELVQSTGCTASEAHQLVDYVFGRDVGETPQEIGGVKVTFAALCLALGQDMDACGEAELARIWTKVEKIRAKQAAKPKHSPLPQHVEPEAAAAPLIEIGVTLQGYTIFRQENGAGGHRYWSDEIGGGVVVWDTCLAGAPTIEWCIAYERKASA